MELWWASHIPTLGPSKTLDGFLDARWEEEVSAVVAVKRSLSLALSINSIVFKCTSTDLQWLLSSSVSFGCYRPLWCGLEARKGQTSSIDCLSLITDLHHQKHKPEFVFILLLFIVQFLTSAFRCDPVYFFFFWPILMSHCQMFHICAQYPVILFQDTFAFHPPN